RSVPGSRAPARAASPSRRSAESDARASRRPTFTRWERQAENVSGQLAGFCELGLCRTTGRRLFLTSALFHRQRLDQLQNVISLVCIDAGDSEQVLTLQVNDIQEASIPGYL